MKISAWAFLVVAAVFEVAWVYCLKYLDFKQIKEIPFRESFTYGEAIQMLMPLIGYIFFGLANIYCFSRSLKDIPVSTAFAVWMALTLTGSKLIDVFLLDHQFTLRSMICMTLILAGVAGLKGE